MRKVSKIFSLSFELNLFNSFYRMSLHEKEINDLCMVYEYRQAHFSFEIVESERSQANVILKFTSYLNWIRISN